ncbi:unnamed protein product [Caenorhabditis angaria]|uniref:NTF2-like domain-containing protein n=1 Tax=Caenorhabditis angaria TaxID=860376 RepID=A0A9P1MXJ9_9PELO|nr:unnamed protein product [Caenorhabditis angaria]
MSSLFLIFSVILLAIFNLTNSTYTENDGLVRAVDLFSKIKDFHKQHDSLNFANCFDENFNFNDCGVKYNKSNYMDQFMNVEDFDESATFNVEQVRAIRFGWSFIVVERFSDGVDFYSNFTAARRAQVTTILPLGSDERRRESDDVI